jgi:hypothetical protein
VKLDAGMHLIFSLFGATGMLEELVYEVKKKHSDSSVSDWYTFHDLE